MAKNKMAGILAVLLVVVIVGGALGYLAVSKRESATRGVLEKELPMEQAVREVEVSIWETANSIFYYTAEPSAMALEEYKKQLKDVEEFMNKYKALIDTEEEKKMVAKFEGMWADCVSRAEELIKLRDKIAEVEEKAWDTVHEADDVIDYKIQVAFVEGIPDLVEKERAVREVEVSIWEAINATNFYLYKRSDKARREFPTQLDDIDEFWGKYKKLNITSTEKPFIKEFEDLWNSAVEKMQECFSLSDEMAEKELAFWESIHEADDVIDFEIQEHLKKRIEAKGKK